MSTQSSPLPSCFRPTIVVDDHQPTAEPPPPRPPTSDSTNLTTCLYYTHLGVFSLTWSRTLFGGRSLHLHLQDNHNHNNSHQFVSPTSSTLSFHLHIKPLLFWKKHGSKKVLVTDSTTAPAQIYWDLSRAKFGSGSEPGSGFYIAVVVDGEMALLVGDLATEAFSRTKAQKPKKAQFLFSRREHVFGNRVYSTTARVGSETRDITIECNVDGDGKLCFGIDRRKIMTVKRLKWKFRGNERVEVDGGVPINISWDVYNWMNFQAAESSDGGPGVFMLKFEKLGFEEEKVVGESCYNNELESFNSFGMNDVELRKMRKSMLKSGRSSSSSSSFSSSSASSGSGSSSVMEWASSEESKLCGPIGFSLVVYAWNKR